MAKPPSDSFMATWDTMSEEQRAQYVAAVQAMPSSQWADSQLVDMMLMQASAASPTPYVALHERDEGIVEMDVQPWIGGAPDEVSPPYVMRRRWQTIGPPTITHPNSKCWLKEESEYGVIHVRGQHVHLEARRQDDPAFPTWASPTENLAYTLVAWVIDPDEDNMVTVHTVKNMVWTVGEWQVSETALMEGIPPTEYPSLREWLEGLTRDIDRHMIDTAQKRRVKLQELTAGGECDIVKWAQTHRTPQDVVRSLEQSGVCLVLSHSEPWLATRVHPDYQSGGGMGFVAVCALGHGPKAIESLERMGYPCRLLRRGKPDIPAVVGLDEQIVRGQAAQDDRRYLRKLGKHNLVDEDAIPEIEA